MSNFEWHLQPSDKFSFENQFSRLTNDSEISLKQMSQILENSRLRDDEILYIWNLINIYNSPLISKIQFVYFMHILTSKRRGRCLPSGLPLDIKQEFLKSEEKDIMFNRPVDHSRSLGDSLTVEELETELKRLDNEIESISKKVTNSTIDLQELHSLKEYKETQLKKLRQDLLNIKSEFERITDDNCDVLVGLIGKLQAEKDDLENHLANFT
jgi:hypothetical protein